MERINGVVIGLVTDLSDPEGLGRIRVSFPWLGDNVQSNWARIAAPMAGGERGVFFQPEIGDEALVAFEQGEVRSPYILGFLWNGDDRGGCTDMRRQKRDYGTWLSSQVRWHNFTRRN